MALIMCPECRKEVSDKCEQCIHCGCTLINYKCIINGIEYNFKNELNIAILNGDDWFSAIGAVRRKTSLTLSDGSDLVEIMRETKKVPETFTPLYPLEDRNKYENQNNIEAIECPYCHSTNTAKITTTAKVVNTALFGLLGNKRKHQWHCNNCRSDF